MRVVGVRRGTHNQLLAEGVLFGDLIVGLEVKSVKTIKMSPVVCNIVINYYLFMYRRQETFLFFLTFICVFLFFNF